MFYLFTHIVQDWIVLTFMSIFLQIWSSKSVSMQ